MATTERRRRRGQRQRRDKHKRGSSRKVARAGDGAAAAAAATTVEDVPDHLLQVILLRLDSSVSLLRAAAACTRWRRVVADAGFLRSFRSLHGARHVVGLYHTVDPCFGSPPPAGGSSVVFVPSSPPPVIGVDSRFFSLDFLPDYHDNDSWSWQLVDSRGGLLLFSKKRKSTSRWAAMAEARCFSFPDLVVCEPLTRRYQGIVSPVYFRRLQCLGVFLLDGDAADADDIGGGIRMSNFRVVAALHGRTWQHDRAVPLACVFTSGSDGGWRVLQSAAAAAVDLPERFDLINFAGRAGGCLYWGIDGEDGAMLVLDEATMRFSIDMFPETIRASYDKWTFRVIDGGGSDDDDGALIRVVRVMRDDLKVFAQIAGSGEWVVKRLVSLREATRGLPGHRETYFRQEAKIVAANAAYVLLTPQEKKKWLFSVELETGKVERRHERNRYAGAAYSYELPWPPALQACADYGGGRRRRR
uniref:F-box domain-containing protein n=1 Tax=Oryza meridionalis TaxID=40149 RepID=A0A0E0D1I4_9ORYZ